MTLIILLCFNYSSNNLIRLGEFIYQEDRYAGAKYFEILKKVSKEKSLQIKAELYYNQIKDVLIIENYHKSPLVAKTYAKYIAERMTSIEKVSQTLIIGFESLGQLEANLNHFNPAGLLIFNMDYDFVRGNYINKVKEKISIEPFIVAFYKDNSIGINSLKIENSEQRDVNNIDLYEHLGFLSGKNLLNLDINLILIPICGYSQNSSISINFNELGEYSLAFLNGLQKSGVITCVFKLNFNKINNDTFLISNFQKDNLFKDIFLSGVKMLMVKYNPKVYNREYINKFKEEALGRTLVITEFLNGIQTDSMPNAVYKAMLSGSDMVLIPGRQGGIDISNIILNLSKRYKMDKKFREIINNSVENILSLKIENGLIQPTKKIEKDFQLDTIIGKTIVYNIYQPFDMNKAIFISEDLLTIEEIQNMGLRITCDLDRIKSFPNYTYILLYPSDELIENLRDLNVDRLIIVKEGLFTRSIDIEYILINDYELSFDSMIEKIREISSKISENSDDI